MQHSRYYILYKYTNIIQHTLLLTVKLSLSIMHVAQHFYAFGVKLSTYFLMMHKKSCDFCIQQLTEKSVMYLHIEVIYLFCNITSMHFLLRFFLSCFQLKYRKVLNQEDFLDK